MGSKGRGIVFGEKFPIPIYKYKTKPCGRFKILGVLMTFVVCYSGNLKILGILNATFFLILRNIEGAIVGFYISICMTGIQHNEEQTISSQFCLKLHGCNVPKFVRNIFERR